LLTAGEPFVYAYYDGVDKISHATDWRHYRAELAAVDHLVGGIAAACRRAVLVVTADHGQSRWTTTWC